MQGPTEVTGKYATRAELTQAIGEMNDAGVTPKKISEITTVSSSTVHGILKKHREAQRIAKTRESKSLISRAWR